MKRLILLAALALVAASTAPAQASNCGQPVSNGVLPVASDALYILQSAVGAQPCRLEHCDVNSDCRVTSSDSLTTLFAAVGRADGLDCSSACPTTIPCEDAGAPVCNGTCPADYACAAIDDGGDDTDSDSDGKRVTVCHRNSGNGNITLVLPSAAVPAHLRHGDDQGPCEDLTAAHKSGGGSDSGDSDADSDSDGSGSVPPEPECACEPISVTTTTMGSTTTTSLEPTTTTTLAPTTTTTLAPPTTTTLAPPTTTTLAPTTTTTLAPTTTTTLAPTTTTTLAPTTTTTTTLPQGPDPAAGMAQYDSQCQFCHKAGAHDTTGFAPDLARKGNKLRNNLGTISNQMSGLMMTNKEIADMAAWLNSL